jgi:hypothetical protein
MIEHAFLSTTNLLTFFTAKLTPFERIMRL